jgi:hypothetical protein
MNLPLIAATDYESFREIMRGNLAHPYDKWFNLHAKWRRDYMAEGHTIRDVNVDPNKFAHFLRETGRAPDIHALLIFTDAVANGEIH